MSTFRWTKKRLLRIWEDIHIDSPYWWYKQAKRNILYPIYNTVSSRRIRPPVRVMDEDWDFLFILDACRADLFRTVADLDRFNTYEEVNSGASATHKWVSFQFTGQAFTDTIYINGNAVVSEHIPTAFYKFIDVWKEDNRRLVPPENISSRLMKESRQNPDKRIIAHFCQPHYPFLDHSELQFESGGETPNNVWHALRRGIVDYDDVWEGYQDNLSRVLDVVVPLAEECDGKVALTADHGNLLGERMWPFPIQEWGHPPGLHHPKLTTVPWAVIGEDRTRAEASEGTNLNDQLAALGYK